VDVEDNFVERFNRTGGPIPAVDPDHLARIWKRVCEVNAQCTEVAALVWSGQGTIGFGAAGVDGISRDDATILGLRVRLLESFVERGIVDERLPGSNLSEETFRAVATFPCNKEELGEALIQLLLKKLPPEKALELRQGAMAEGYNPDESKIDAKFREWKRNEFR
jgi:hypothetical protein